MNLSTFDVNQLSEMRGQVRSNIRNLEKLGYARSVRETINLADQRRLYRNLCAEIKRRFVQKHLF